jgi:hypothetical protein
MRVTVFLGIALIGAVKPGMAQTPSGPTIRGWVVDTAGRAVAFARVTGGGSARVADDSGRFLLVMPRAGAVTLEVRRVGFRPLETRERFTGDTTVRLVMMPLPASLAAVRIEAEATERSLDLGGFYDRFREKQRGTNTGHFILPEEIERRTGSVLQVMTGTPGVRIDRYRFAGAEWNAIFGNSRCAMTVYLNRTRLPPPAQFDRNIQRFIPPDVSEFVTLREVAGIEMYSRSNAPSEFAMLNGSCGVVVIWTK